jgi:hypothetical protein
LGVRLCSRLQAAAAAERQQVEQADHRLVVQVAQQMGRPLEPILRVVAEEQEMELAVVEGLALFILGTRSNNGSFRRNI